MCNLVQNHQSSTSSKSFAAKIGYAFQVSLSTILAMQFQELYPQCCHSDEERRAMLDYMLDLEETTRQVGFVNVCSILTDPRQRTDTATVPY